MLSHLVSLSLYNQMAKSTFISLNEKSFEATAVAAVARLSKSVENTVLEFALEKNWTVPQNSIAIHVTIVELASVYFAVAISKIIAT